MKNQFEIFNVYKEQINLSILTIFKGPVAVVEGGVSTVFLLAVVGDTDAGNGEVALLSIFFCFSCLIFSRPSRSHEGSCLCDLDSVNVSTLLKNGLCNEDSIEF